MIGGDALGEGCDANKFAIGVETWGTKKMIMKNVFESILRESDVTGQQKGRHSLYPET